MLGRRRMIIWSLISIVTAASATIAIEKARPRLDAANHSTLNNTASPVALTLNQAPRPKPRNLSLQPEAFKLSKRLGLRFKASRNDISVLAGTLTTGGERQSIQIIRRQGERGERVEIAVAGGPALLSWSETEGPRGSGGTPSNLERALIERLALDSADQFILAQLRGASYYTVARNVRPVEAGDSDNYNGPLWNIVRVNDPERDEQKRPSSRWRLYYINTTTGLIDRIVSDVEGQRIIAEFTWTEILGEKVPAQITWTRQGQTLMQYQLTTFAHGQEGGV